MEFTEIAHLAPFLPFTSWFIIGINGMREQKKHTTNLVVESEECSSLLCFPSVCVHGLANFRWVHELDSLKLPISLQNDRSPWTPFVRKRPIQREQKEAY